MNFLKEYDGNSDEVVLAEYSDPAGNKYYFLINEATQEVSFATKSKSAIKDFKDFLMRHPYMTGMAVGIGINALDAYRANKRLTTRFFATNQVEKKLYKNVVEDLIKTGKYVLLKNAKPMHGGWLWELKRQGI